MGRALVTGTNRNESTESQLIESAPPEAEGGAGFGLGFEIRAERWGEVTCRGEAIRARTGLDKQFGKSFCQQEAFA